MTRSTALVAILAMWSGAATGGCTLDQPSRDRPANQLAKAETKLHHAQRRNEALLLELGEKNKQIDSLLALGEKRLESLYQVKRIALGRYTGAVDLDGKPGDDAIKVYLRPIDQDGSVIKAPGTVKIELFDLSAGPAENLVGKYQWTVEQISKQWSGGFGAYHFSFTCPWQSDPPAGDEITVRLEFVDYLTGKVFVAQKLCKIKSVGQDSQQ